MTETVTVQFMGQLCLKGTSLTKSQLEEALQIQAQQTAPLRLGEILVNRGWLSDVEVARVLAAQWDYDYTDTIPRDQIVGERLRGLPIEFLKKHHMLPFQDENGVVCLALADPLDVQAIDAIVNSLDTPCLKVVCTAAVIEEGLSHCYYQDGDSGTLEQMDDSQTLAEWTVESDAQDLLTGAGDAPMIRLVNTFLFQATQSRASDIHIEPYEQDVKVRFRIDGVLHTQTTVPKRFYAPLVSRLKIMAKLNIAERRLPQDGRSRIKIGDREIDIRMSTVPTSGGERIVLRLLDEAGSDFNMAHLGFEPDTQTQFQRLIHRPHGIVLITGPTGSGKTTTLYGALTELNCDSRNIMTVEDPIEYRLADVGQMQVKPKIGLTFASCLRHILRQDPDVIMVGEIRDLETARIAIQSALTGHLVLSTLHTNDSVSAVTRLIDMGIEPYLVCSSVLAIMAQRLVRRVCPECQASDVADDPTSVCSNCGGTGFRGRRGIFELLTMDDGIRAMILGNGRAHDIKEAAIAKGMLTLRQDGMMKVARDETTIEEVLRVTQDDEEPNQSGIGDACVTV
jgi:general secretion pathway protein E